MARIRTIKPEFPQSETIGKLSRDARLLFIQLWTLADDAGRTRAASRMLASLLYPYDDDAAGLIEGWLSELEHNDCIVRYDADGSRYLEIANWLKHQKIDKPSASKMPCPLEGSRIVANGREASSLDLGPRTMDHSLVSSETLEPEREKSEKQKKENPLEILKTCLSDKTARDIIAHRKALKSPLTDRAAELLVEKFAAYGDPELAASTMIGKGWKGFEPHWEGIPPPRAKHPADDAAVAGFYAAAGSPQLEAWQDHGRRMNGKSFPVDARGGWRFPSEYPPADERAA
jgi:hypothetical protein